MNAQLSRAYRTLLLMLVAALAVTAVACDKKPAAPAVSANAWAVVNGREITRDAVEKAFRRNAQGQPPSDEEAVAAKLSVLDELIVQELLLAKAASLQIAVPDSELDAAYLEARKNIPDADFNKELASRNLTAADMREGLRRDMTVQKLLEREVSSKVTVTDQDITSFFEANKAQFNRTEDAYRLAQILITPTREQQVPNRTGSDATTPQEATAKLQMVTDRLKGGANFSEVAADFSEDPQSAPRGGDLGFVPVSALRQAAPQLRDAVLNAQPGSVRVLSGNGAHTVMLVVGKDAAGQKDPSMPDVKEAISRGLRERREQLLRTAYVADVRNDAKITNVVAKTLVAAQGKVPASLAPTAPGAAK